MPPARFGASLRDGRYFLRRRGRPGSVFNHRRHKAIATPGKGFNEAGILGRITDSFAEALDGVVQPGFEVDERVGRPEALPEFLSRYDLTGIFQQDLENLEGLFLELEPDAPLAQLSRAQVCLERTKAYPPRHRAHALHEDLPSF
jgi:hypothetical protein